MANIDTFRPKVQISNYAAVLRGYAKTPEVLKSSIVNVSTDWSYGQRIINQLMISSFKSINNSLPS